MSGNKHLTTLRSSAAEYLTFVAASGQGGIEAVYADEDVWLSQKMMGELYGVNVRTVSEHLKNIFADSELQAEAVIRKFRITANVAKNSLNGSERAQLQRLVNAYLDIAEDMAQRQIPMTMTDWEERLNRFIAATDREVLQDAGKVTAEIAKAHAETEFEKFRIVQDRLYQSDFDRQINTLASTAKRSGGEDA